MQYKIQIKPQIYHLNPKGFKDHCLVALIYHYETKHLLNGRPVVVFTSKKKKKKALRKSSLKINLARKS